MRKQRVQGLYRKHATNRKKEVFVRCIGDKKNEIRRAVDLATVIKASDLGRPLIRYADPLGYLAGKHDQGEAFAALLGSFRLDPEPGEPSMMTVKDIFLC